MLVEFLGGFLELGKKYDNKNFYYLHNKNYIFSEKNCEYIAYIKNDLTKFKLDIEPDINFIPYLCEDVNWNWKRIGIEISDGIFIKFKILKDNLWINEKCVNEKIRKYKLEKILHEK